jgi:predicted amidohydrolase
MRETVKICLAQLAYAPGEGHIEKLRGVISDNLASDLIVFPELILHGHPSDAVPEGMLYRRMRLLYKYKKRSADLYRFVREVDARVIIGEMLKRGERYYNLATYVDRDKKESYAKTHVHWTEHFTPGRQLKVFSSPVGEIGINICFDAAFPEVWRVLALRGAEILVNISAVPMEFSKEYMYRRMIGAAIQNQAYVVYVNRAGEAFSGGSAVFSPRGELMASVGGDEAVVDVKLDMGEVRRWREEELNYPFRRPTLYKDISRKPRLG